MPFLLAVNMQYLSTAAGLVSLVSAMAILFTWPIKTLCLSSPMPMGDKSPLHSLTSMRSHLWNSACTSPGNPFSVFHSLVEK